MSALWRNGYHRCGYGKPLCGWHVDELPLAAGHGRSATHIHCRTDKRMNDKTSAEMETTASAAQDGTANADMVASNKRTLEEAFDECTRENEVRKRCYGKWIDEGRLSRSDARDRTERLAAAIEFLKRMLDGDIAVL